jgi:membrane protease subunit HflK
MLDSILKKTGLKFSLNDPRWGRGQQDDQKPNQGGKRPDDGPPDLDQLWRDFNQRLNRLLGSKGGGDSGGGNSGGGDGPSMRGAGIGALVVALIVAFLWLISGFFIVQEGQTGVVLTFGKYSHSTPAGFNWRWPYPIQDHEIVNVSTVRTVEVGYRSTVRNKEPREALMLTEDENIIDIQFAVQYTLKSAADWVFSNRNPDDTMKQIAETSIREVVGKRKMDFVLYEGREQVAMDVHQLMQQIADRYKIGVQVNNVEMLAVQPPEQVQAAFDDAVKAGQDRERLKNEGQAYANNVIPRARGTAARLQQESEAYRSRVVATAEGDASRFRQVLVEYQKAPAVTRERMYIETMQQIFENTSKILTDTRGGNNLIYLPLDKLISQSAQGAEPGDPRASVTQSGVAAGSAGQSAEDAGAAAEMQRQRDARSRDSRNREVR